MDGHMAFYNDKAKEDYRLLSEIEELIKALQEELVSEDLEEAAIMHYKDVMEYEAKTGLKPAYTTSFKAGAKWQKQKTIDKACDYVASLIRLDNDVVDDFRKALEKEDRI